LTANFVIAVHPDAKPPTFAPGPTLSAVDVIVLLAGGWGTWFVGREIWWAGMLIGFVVGHFFLFCNVFRISRGAELVWAGVFVVLAGTNIATGVPGWTITIVGALLLTTVLVVREMKKPWYHGLAWQRVNPNLRTWWETNGTAQIPTAQIPKRDQDSSSEQQHHADATTGSSDS
jgi:hypothetical protein